MSTRLQVHQHGTPALTFTPLRTSLLRRNCACGGPPGLDGACAECRGQRLGVWPKPTIGAPHDRYEQEADRVVDAVEHDDDHDIWLALQRPLRLVLPK
jgi:hypothetical protein